MRNRCVMLTAVLAAVLGGCGGEDGTESFSEVRTVKAPELQTADQSAVNPHAGGTMPLQPSSGESLQWTVPEGWVELNPSSMRIANLGIEGESSVECYVTRLSGAAGGLDANLNRWRGQLSLPPYTAEEISALPTMEILGDDAVLAEMEGTYSGMGGSAPQDGFALFGAVAQAGGASYFVKMTGPSDVLQRERENFKIFCTSLNLGSGAAMASVPDAQTDPHAGLTNPGVQPAASLQWTAPASWNQMPDRPMRVATFTVNGAECYVATLSGRAGGAAANINRWRTQMGAAPLSPDDLAALATITVLGKPSPLVDVSGAYTGMDGSQTSDAMLLGVVREDEIESVFIKMTGPKDAVLAERENFVAFCESLE